MKEIDSSDHEQAYIPDGLERVCGEVLLHSGVKVEHFSSLTGEWSAFEPPRPAVAVTADSYPPIDLDNAENQDTHWL